MSVSCSQFELKSAYRSLVLRCHPDKGGDCTEFARVKAAYEVLSREDLREVYNEEGFEGLVFAHPDFDPKPFSS